MIAFLCAGGAAYFGGRAAEALSGTLVTAFLAALSLKKTYRSRVGALGALVTVGLNGAAYLGGLAVSALTAGSGGGKVDGGVLAAVSAACLAAVLAAVLLETGEIRRETKALAAEGRKRRMNPVFLVVSGLLAAGGGVMLLLGHEFGGAWLLILGVARGLLEVGA